MNISKFKNKYRTETSRLKGWDYSTPGAYFVTICTKNLFQYFGKITPDDKFNSIDEIRNLVKLNDAGNIVNEEWLNTLILRKNVILDEFVIMPNHFHGIIFIIDAKIYRRDALHASLKKEKAHEKNIFDEFNLPSIGDTRSVSLHAAQYKNEFGKQSNNLASIVGGFKSACTSRIHKTGTTNFAWQSRFHDHIIRNEKSLNKIREYIIHNPIKWKHDKYFKKTKF